MKVADVITNRIIEKLEAGTVPWQKPWSGGSWPKNVVSKKEYRGVNSFVLGCSEFSSPYWGTFKQISDLGGTITKGQHGSPVLFYTWLEDKSDFEVERKIPFMRFYKVWNLEQTTGVDMSKVPVAVVLNDNEKLDMCESIIKNMPLRPEIKFKEARAYYSPTLDIVNMPRMETFKDSESYYSTIYHELGHSTGHKSRLARKDFDGNCFGSDSYSKEELVAELTASFLMSVCGIENKTIDNSASYIQSWIRKFKNYKNLLISASSQAQKAFDFITNKRFEVDND